MGRKDYRRYLWLDILITSFIGIIWEILEYLTIPDNIDYWTVDSIAFGWMDTQGDMVANIIGLVLGIIIVKLNKSFNNS